MNEAYPDAAAVVLDLKQLHPALLDRDFDRSCASIEAVLYELLEC